MPAAARVRPPSATTHNFALLAVRHGYRNDFTPCRMALHFDYASAHATTPSKRPAATATRGSSYTAPLTLRFLYSFTEVAINVIVDETTLTIRSNIQGEYKPGGGAVNQDITLSCVSKGIIESQLGQQIIR